MLRVRASQDPGVRAEGQRRSQEPSRRAEDWEKAGSKAGGTGVNAA